MVNVKICLYFENNNLSDLRSYFLRGVKGCKKVACCSLILLERLLYTLKNYTPLLYIDMFWNEMLIVEEMTFIFTAFFIVISLIFRYSIDIKQKYWFFSSTFLFIKYHTYFLILIMFPPFTPPPLSLSLSLLSLLF